jgi:hypothetical protein
MDSMQLTTAYRCPICAENMQLNGVFSITFSDGASDYVLKYACNACHVEMSRTEKTPFRPAREYPPIVDAPATADEFSADMRVVVLPRPKANA